MSERPLSAMAPPAHRAARVGRADLLRFLASVPDADPVQREQAARLLGLPRLPRDVFGNDEDVVDRFSDGPLNDELHLGKFLPKVEATHHRRVPELLVATELTLPEGLPPSDGTQRGIGEVTPAEAATIAAMLEDPDLAPPQVQPLMPPERLAHLL